MANNTTNFTLKLKTEGLESAQKGTKQIRDNLEGAQAAAQGINTSASSRRFASSAASRPTGAAGASAGVEGGDVEMYNRARGAAGAAGGTARDFADQARGLGGLVRLYATFAANIFAATAAFGALSRAMDTTNMIRGLDQLGASSGQALGTLSKRLAQATDNAVSLREAMEATVKASSAGLDSSQILRLGESARKASQALGLSMPDALSRLSRGISKLEPELLDELGIFVRIDDAVQKYALSVGKTASTLTDFERRQAFATAVLAQAEQKFSAIQIDANPYNKLLATLQNTAQQILEIFNKVLSPIVKVFAENSGLVAAAIGLITLKLLNSALPALGQWQQGLVASANKAKEAASNINTSFGEATVEGWEKKLQIPELVQSVDKAKASLSSLGTGKDLLGITNVQKLMTKISKAPETLTGRDVGSLTREINSRQKAVESLSTASDAASLKQAANLQKEIARLEKIKTQTLELIALQKQLAAQRAKLSEIDVREGTGLGERARQTISRRENERAQRLSAIAAVPQNVAELGFGTAWEKLRAEAAKSSGAISKFRTLAVGGLVAVGSQVGLLARAFGGKLLNGVLLAIGVFQTLDSIFSGNAKEAGQFKSALESLADGVKLVNDTLENLRKQEFSNALSAQNIVARANAFGELAGSIEQVSNSFAAVVGKASFWDRWVKNLFLSAFDAGWQDDLAQSLSTGIVSAIDSIQSDEIKQKYIASISNILNIENVNQENIARAIKKLPEEQAKAAAASVRAVTKDAANDAKVLANTLLEASNSIKKVADARQALDNSFKDTSPVSNYAAALVEESGKIAKAFENPINSLSLLNEIVSDNTKLSLFPDNVRAELIAAKNDIQKATQQVGLYEEQIKQAEKATEQLVSFNTGGTSGTITFDLQVQESPEYQKLQEIVAVGQRAVELKTKLKENITELQEKFKNIAVSPFERAITIVSQKFTDSLAKSGLTIQTGIASLFGEGTGKAALEGSLKQQELSLQSKNIEATFSLTQELRRNTLATERQTVLQEIENDKRAGVVNERRAEGQASRLREIDDAFKFLDRGLKATAADFRKLGTSFQQSLFSYFQNLLGAKGQQAEIAAQAKVSEIGTQVKTKEESFKEKEKIRNVELERLNIEKERAGIIANILGLENTTAQNKKIAAENAAQQQSDEIKRQQLKFNIEQQSFIYSKLAEQLGKSKNKQDIKNLENAKGIVTSAKQELQNFEKSVKERNKLKEINDEILKISSETAAEQKRLELDKQRKDLADELQQIQLNVRKQEFDALVALDALTEDYAANRKAQFALESQQIQYNRQLREAANQKELQDLEVLSRARKLAATGAEPALVQSFQEEEQAKINSQYQQRIAIIQSTNTLAVRSIELEQQKALEVAKTNKLLEDQKNRAELIASFGDSLTAAFGTAGTAIAGVLSSLNDMATAQETFNSKLQQQNDIQAKAAKIMDDPNFNLEDREAATNAYNKAEKTKGELISKNAKDELTNAGKVVGATKSLFKEKTFAYKALAAVEKAIHIAKLAMMIKEMFFDKKSVVETIANSGAKSAAKGAEAGVDGVAAVVKTIASLPFPANLLAGAVVAGVVANLLSSIGESGPPAPTGGTTSADRQETQGTGMTWRDGKKVETGGGVFGDSEAKSESIAKSIEILKDNSIEGLSYDNKMIMLLESIDRSIGSAAKGLYSIQGLRTGSMFETQEGTRSGGGLFGTGLFASKTTQTIIDSGIRIKGTFAQLAGDVAGGTALFYETVQNTTKKWYGKTKTSISENVTQADQLLSLFESVFSNATDLFVELGNKLGKSESEIIQLLSSVDASVEASLRGLKGEDLEKEIQAVISSKLDDATRALFGGIVEKYQEFGEGALETIIRVIDAAEKVTLSFRSIGIEFASAGNGITDTTLEITQSLVDLAGGLDKFIEQNKTFADKFLTDLERLAPVQQAVTNRLNQLNLGWVNTREEFKNVIYSLDLTTESGRETYQALMEVAGGFADVTEQYEKLLDEVASINNDAATRFMTDAEKLVYTRNLEREAIQETNRELFDYITQLKSADLALNNATKALLDGFEKIKKAADTARQELVNFAQNGLQRLRNDVKSAQQALEDFALNTLQKLRDSVSSAQQRLEDFALNTLQTLRDKVKSARQELEDFALNTLQTLRDKAESARQTLEDFALNTLQKLRDNAESARQRLEEFALNTLQTLRDKAESARETLEDFALNTLETLRDKADSAKETLRDFALNTLQTLREKADAAKETLEDFALNTLQTLRDRSSSAKQELQDFALNTLQTLRERAQTASDALNSLTDNLKQFYRDAVAAQNTAFEGLRTAIQEGEAKVAEAEAKRKEILQEITQGYLGALAELSSAQQELTNYTENQTKAIVSGLRSMSKSLKEFINSLYTSELGFATQSQKLEFIKQDYEATLRKARTGDVQAGEKLPEISRQLLEAAKEQSSSRLDYQRVFAKVTDDLSSISKGIDQQYGAEPLTQQDEQQAILDRIASAQAALTTWEAAIVESGAERETVEKSAIERFRETDTELKKVKTELQDFKDSIEELGIDLADLATPEQSVYDTAITSYKNATTAVQAWTQALIDSGIDINAVNEEAESPTSLTSKIISARENLATIQTNITDWLGLLSTLAIEVPDEQDPSYQSYVTSLTNLNTGYQQSLTELNDWIGTLQGMGIEIPPEEDPSYQSYVTNLGNLNTSYQQSLTDLNDWIVRLQGLGIEIPPEEDEGYQSYVTNLSNLNTSYQQSLTDLNDWIVRLQGLGIEIPPEEDEGYQSYVTNLSNLNTSYQQSLTDLNDWIVRLQGLGIEIPPEEDEGYQSYVTNLSNLNTSYQQSLTDLNDWIVRLQGLGIEIPSEEDGGYQSYVTNLGDLNTTYQQSLTNLNSWISLLTGLGIEVPPEEDEGYQSYVTNLGNLNTSYQQSLIDLNDWISRLQGMGIEVPPEEDEGYQSYVTNLTNLNTSYQQSLTDLNDWITRLQGLGIEIPTEEDPSYQSYVTKLTNLNAGYQQSLTDLSNWIGMMQEAGIEVPTEEDPSFQGLVTRFNNLNQTYQDALDDVDDWQTRLTELGISFTPYGSETGPNLETLTADFLTAKTAFDDANSRINTWITSVSTLANSVIPPTVINDTVTTTATSTSSAAGSAAAVGTGTAAGDRKQIYWGFNGTDFGFYWLQDGVPVFLNSPSYAMGGVFEQGRTLKRFASGGAFTNSVVSNPTMFSMGLMGEAGPEAIMPLTRGPGGRLGVDASGMGGSNNQELLAELRAMRDELNKLRLSSDRTEAHNKKTKETLIRVTRDGEGMVLAS